MMLFGAATSGASTREASVKSSESLSTASATPGSGRPIATPGSSFPAIATRGSAPSTALVLAIPGNSHSANTGIKRNSSSQIGTSRAAPCNVALPASKRLKGEPDPSTALVLWVGATSSAPEASKSLIPSNPRNPSYTLVPDLPNPPNRSNPQAPNPPNSFISIVPNPPNRQAPNPSNPPHHQAPNPSNPPHRQAPNPTDFNPPNRQAPNLSNPPNRHAPNPSNLPSRQAPNPPSRQAPNPSNPPSHQAPNLPSRQAHNPSNPPNRQAPNLSNPPNRQAPNPSNLPNHQAPNLSNPPSFQAPNPSNPPSRQALNPSNPPNRQAPNPSMPPSAPEISPVEQLKSRYLSHPSNGTLERMERLYGLSLVTMKLFGDPPTSGVFHVLGSTKNVYEVKLQHEPRCSCPDFWSHPCKHILFVTLRVLNLDEDDPIVWQHALLTSELKAILSNAHFNRSVLASRRMRDGYRQILESKMAAEAKAAARAEKLKRTCGNCPVCSARFYDGAGKVLKTKIFCSSSRTDVTYVICKSCGTNLHEACYNRWIESDRWNGRQTTCERCCNLWEEEDSEDNSDEDSDAESEEDSYESDDEYSDENSDDERVENHYVNLAHFSGY